MNPFLHRLVTLAGVTMFTVTCALLAAHKVPCTALDIAWAATGIVFPLAWLAACVRTRGQFLMADHTRKSRRALVRRSTRSR